jgi:hypothetical protein
MRLLQLGLNDTLGLSHQKVLAFLYNLLKRLKQE